MKNIVPQNCAANSSAGTSNSDGGWGVKMKMSDRE
jgi:hypothetical protein